VLLFMISRRNVSENQISIIIPTYNEAENICPILESISENLPKNSETEVIIIDDDSPDGTSSLIENYKKLIQIPHYSVSLIKRKGERGLSTAILRGIEKATGNLIVVMDSDLSHPPHVIPQMIETLQNTKCDIVIASRYISGGAIKGWPIKRRMISKGATKIAQTGLGIKTNDPMSGFFAFRRHILNGIKFDAIGYKILLEILVKVNGVKIEEIPYTFVDRKYSSSKLDASTIFDYCRAVWKLYRYGKSKRAAEKRTSVRFLSKAARFFTVGASGVLVNIIVSMFFETEIINFWYLHANVVGILVSMTSNFFLNKIWTFEDKIFTFKRTSFQYGKFIFFSSLGAIVQLSMVFYLVEEHGFWYPLALILGVMIAAMSNFILNKKWTFNEKIWD